MIDKEWRKAKQSSPNYWRKTIDNLKLVVISSFTRENLVIQCGYTWGYETYETKIFHSEVDHAESKNKRRKLKD